MIDFFLAAFLGFIEGLTEFIPVSSTGHLVVLVDGLNFKAPPGRVFEVFIQLGAIFAVMLLYRKKIFDTIVGLPRDPVARRFALNIILGTIPAIALGALFHDVIKALYMPVLIGCTLIVGGVIILLLEKRLKAARIETIDDISWRAALLIGCCQALALIPGVSRSGATIMGALGLGVARPVAAEFSFFLAMPVMIAGVTFDLWRNWEELKAFGDWNLLVVGFIAAFLTALVVVKAAMRIISRYGFTPFAWYRIAFGFIVLVIFAL